MIETNRKIWLNFSSMKSKTKKTPKHYIQYHTLKNRSNTGKIVHHFKRMFLVIVKLSDRKGSGEYRIEGEKFLQRGGKGSGCSSVRCRIGKSSCFIRDQWWQHISNQFSHAPLLMASLYPISGTRSPWKHSTVPVSFAWFYLIMQTLNYPTLSQKKGDFRTIRCFEGTVLRNHIHISFTMAHYWGSSIIAVVDFFTDSSLQAKICVCI